MVDGERLRSLLDRLDEELGHLRRLAASGETLLTDPDAMAGVKYRFVVVNPPRPGVRPLGHVVVTTFE